MTIDLRSDTVTRPSAAMRAAMAAAEVGDDVYGDDPTVRALEAKTAELLGKEAALFVPSGTMGNQVAIMCHTSRGDEVYTGEGSHCIWYESGAAGALSGVQLTEVGKGGIFTAEELAAALKPRAYYCPNPRLVVVENTHNRGGGTTFPAGSVERIAALTRAQGLALHLDGARIWNAAVATGRTPRELASHVDTASVCFSKGLGAPVGSALVGSAELIVRARRFRKMLGGGMRQVGVLAAAAIYALDHHRERLAEDHANAKRFADVVRAAHGADVPAPETNIVMIDLAVPAERVALELEARGIQVSVFGATRLRVVTHLDVSREQVELAARAAAEVVSSLARAGDDARGA